MRLANRILMAVLMLLLFCAAIITSIEVIYAAFDRPNFVVPHDRWYETLDETVWDAASVRWVGIGLVFAGLVLLWMQIKRRPVIALPLESRGSIQANVMRTELARSLERSVLGLEGVESVRVKMAPKKVKARARSSRDDRDAVGNAVKEDISNLLDVLRLETKPSVKVKMRRGIED